jgi:hypothetical protein
VHSADETARGPRAALRQPWWMLSLTPLVHGAQLNSLSEAESNTRFLTVVVNAPPTHDPSSSC